MHVVSRQRLTCGTALPYLSAGHAIKHPCHPTFPAGVSVHGGDADAGHLCHTGGLIGCALEAAGPGTGPLESVAPAEGLGSGLGARGTGSLFLTWQQLERDLQFMQTAGVMTHLLAYKWVRMRASDWFHDLHS